MLDDDTSTGQPLRARGGGVVTVAKTLAVLEVVAEHGGASAKEVSTALGFSLPTTYRLLQVLVGCEYLVHLKADKRFELGYKLDRLGVCLHRQVGVPRPVREEVDRLHRSVGAAAYFAVYRGADVVVAHVSDCHDHPRISPMGFGFHEAAHATAFGKILLAGMTAEDAGQYLDAHGTPPMTTATITDRSTLDQHLAEVSRRGIAWERQEFVTGTTCAAVAVHDAAGSVVGSVAISTPERGLDGRRAALVERGLRAGANEVSRWLRTG